MEFKKEILKLFKQLNIDYGDSWFNTIKSTYYKMCLADEYYSLNEVVSNLNSFLGYLKLPCGLILEAGRLTIPDTVYFINEGGFVCGKGYPFYASLLSRDVKSEEITLDEDRGIVVDSLEISKDSTRKIQQFLFKKLLNETL